MTMPIDLVFVRHGKAENNAANRRGRAGDYAAFTPELRARHNSKFRLTTLGREQSAAAGKWIRENLGLPFDRYYVSTYLKAIETAGLLDIPGAGWYVDPLLRELNWGHLDEMMPPGERESKFGHQLKCRSRDGIYWAPSGGESVPDVVQRLSPFFQALHRAASSKRILVVTHLNVIWACRMKVERLPPWRCEELMASKDERDRIHDCQVLHYTREDPQNGRVAREMRWMRSVCPWNLELSRNEWERITRPKFSNNELLALAERVPRLLDD